MTIEVISTPNTKTQAETVSKEEKEVKATTEVVDPKATEEILAADGSDATEGDELSNEENEDKEELEASETETSEEKPKKKSGFKRRIDKLNKRVSDIEQEKEYWRQEALRVQQNSKGATQDDKNKPVEKSTDPKRPKADDFTSHDEFVEALTDWKMDQRDSAKEQKQKEAAIKSEFQTKQQKYAELADKFKESHDDWDDVVKAHGVTVTLPVQEAIIDSEIGPDVYYALAKEPKELARICALPPIQAAKEIGKIEARLSTKTSETSQRKLTSTAPPPVSAVKARGTALTKSIFDKNITQSEYEKLRRAEKKASW